MKHVRIALFISVSIVFTGLVSPSSMVFDFFRSKTQNVASNKHCYRQCMIKYQPWVKISGIEVIQESCIVQCLQD
jgi:hypothetical protein